AAKAAGSAACSGTQATENASRSDPVLSRFSDVGCQGRRERRVLRARKRPRTPAAPMLSRFSDVGCQGRRERRVLRARKRPRTPADRIRCSAGSQTWAAKAAGSAACSGTQATENAGSARLRTGSGYFEELLAHGIDDRLHARVQLQLLQ